MAFISLINSLLFHSPSNVFQILKAPIPPHATAAQQLRRTPLLQQNRTTAFNSSMMATLSIMLTNYR
ncbi:hypothetical protein Scep_026761 [Stephania cephalantha]|uniref:Uncharacterized protein n=1 Tax=Stephania cephalantha TaxID=152367 RepID=A0AAP0HSB8_9MAGN